MASSKSARGHTVDKDEDTHTRYRHTLTPHSHASGREERSPISKSPPPWSPSHSPDGPQNGHLWTKLGSRPTNKQEGCRPIPKPAHTIGRCTPSPFSSGGKSHRFGIHTSFLGRTRGAGTFPKVYDSQLGMPSLLVPQGTQRERRRKGKRKQHPRNRQAT